MTETEAFSCKDFLPGITEIMCIIINLMDKILDLLV